MSCTRRSPDHPWWRSPGGISRSSPESAAASPRSCRPSSRAERLRQPPSPSGSVRAARSATSLPRRIPRAVMKLATICCLGPSRGRSLTCSFVVVGREGERQERGQRAGQGQDAGRQDRGQGSGPAGAGTGTEDPARARRARRRGSAGRRGGRGRSRDGRSGGRAQAEGQERRQSGARGGQRRPQSQQSRPLTSERAIRRESCPPAQSAGHRNR